MKQAPSDLEHLCHCPRQTLLGCWNQSLHHNSARHLLLSAQILSSHLQPPLLQALSSYPPPPPPQVSSSYWPLPAPSSSATTRHLFHPRSSAATRHLLHRFSAAQPSHCRLPTTTCHIIFPMSLPPSLPPPPLTHSFPTTHRLFLA